VLVKLAEFMFIKEKTGRAPIFLLDDLFAKLDLKRSDAVFELLKKNTQTIITNTDLFNLKNHGIDLETPDNKSFHLAR
jgi:recombinational DNA repair ATPase RecF